MSATCPRGHTSDSTDYCDVCGALITPSGGSGAEAGSGAGAAAAGTASPEAAEPARTSTGAAEAAGVPCPRCGATNLSSAGFCEDCGLNFSDVAAVAAAAASAPTGSTPAGAGAAHAATPEPPAAAAPSGWEARVIADRAYFDRTDAGDGEITFPPDCPERVIPLPVGEVTIGRRSHASRAAPVIDLAEPPEDVGVSHAHATLTQRPDGQWEVTDSKSTNGTFIGDADAPLSPGESIGVGEGDEIHVGAWSTIILSRTELPPA